MPISLILTPFHHFHFRPTSGLLSSQDLTYCHVRSSSSTSSLHLGSTGWSANCQRVSQLTRSSSDMFFVDLVTRTMIRTIRTMIRRIVTMTVRVIMLKVTIDENENVTLIQIHIGSVQLLKMIFWSFSLTHNCVLCHNFHNCHSITCGLCDL